MTMRFLSILILLTTSCQIDKDDVYVFDPVLTSQDLTEEKLKDKGFKKVIANSKTFYTYNDEFRQIKYEIDEDEIVSRTFRIKYEDLDKFLNKHDAEIIARNDKDDFIKFKIRNQEVIGEVIREMDRRYIVIFTDWFHIIMN